MTAALEIRTPHPEQHRAKPGRRVWEPLARRVDSIDLASVKILGERFHTCNIAPGAIATEINRSLLDDRPKVERLLKQIPLGRMGKPEDVAAVAAFLASRDADYIT